ncbi:SatD family protein [Gaetbulibacter aestuarii]|uniref:SatD family protein n=1 Tax=Gaetbulibacter aestuarii TaxID=1502358 RepID=A0ABW7MZ37_9FLAO
MDIFFVYLLFDFYLITNDMTSIITGDIINSRAENPEKWLPALKETLAFFGKSPKQWEIYRGDSFQLEVSPDKALLACALIKATIKQFKNIDVRLAIGIGDKSYDSDKITESNGTAFEHSGTCFETMKQSTLAIKSPNNTFDDTLNTMFALAQLTMNSWNTTASEIIKITLKQPELDQNDLAELLGKSQGNISKVLKRAGFDEISKLLNYYKTQVQKL